MPSSLEFIENQQGQFIHINNESCSAIISLFGGHITHWQPHGQSPVLWLSDTSDDSGTKAIRGGIPVCWPWFAEHPEHGRHGLVRTALWELTDTKEESDITVVTLSCTINAPTDWRYPTKIEQTIIVGRTLDQTFKVHNTSAYSVKFAYALHNYLAVSHIDTIDVTGLQNVPFENKITQSNSEGEPEQPNFAGPIDRIYRTQNKIQLFDHTLNRYITLEQRTGNECVVWNPGVTANKMDDIHKDGEKQFICLEAAHTQPLSLKPNESLSFGQRLTVKTE